MSDKCATRKLDKIEKLQEDIVDLKLQVRTIENNFTHTIANKHQEAISTARSIDMKFKWTSFIIGGLSLVGLLLSLIKIIS